MKFGIFSPVKITVMGLCLSVGGKYEIKMLVI